MYQLMWFRSDLRVHDNPALCAAMGNGPTLALYILTPEQWREHNDAPCKIDFWLRNLRTLRQALGRLGVPLLIRQVPTWVEIPQLMAELVQTHNIRAVAVNEEYGVNEARRDQAVGRQLASQGIGFSSHLDQVLFPPGSIRNRAGGFFQVFSQFRRVCHQRLHLGPPAPVPPPALQPPPPDICGDAVPTRVSGFNPPAPSLTELWPAGEAAAQARLDTFAEQQLARYHQQRDLPAEPGTSRLSPYLTAGVLSVRQCLNAALIRNKGVFDGGNEGIVSWIKELLWREFYKHVLTGFPRVSMGRAFRVQTEAIAWRQAPDELRAWQEGRTGFPLVDAAMRQLVDTGWMHNRLRMVVAMFLTKNLLIDWREGERFFMQHLIDGDLAANNGGWQWSASTGTDAVPWFRIFNPLTQSRRFDPKGHFIRQWVPELAHLDNRSIHLPPGAGDLFSSVDYPATMVDLAQSRERALRAFRSLGT